MTFTCFQDHESYKKKRFTNQHMLLSLCVVTLKMVKGHQNWSKCQVLWKLASCKVFNVCVCMCACVHMCVFVHVYWAVVSLYSVYFYFSFFFCLCCDCLWWQYVVSGIHKSVFHKNPARIHLNSMHALPWQHVPKEIWKWKLYLQFDFYEQNIDQNVKLYGS